MVVQIAGNNFIHDGIMYPLSNTYALESAYAVDRERARTNELYPEGHSNEIMAQKKFGMSYNDLVSQGQHYYIPNLLSEMYLVDVGANKSLGNTANECLRTLQKNGVFMSGTTTFREGTASSGGIEATEGSGVYDPDTNTTRDFLGDLALPEHGLIIGQDLTTAPKKESTTDVISSTPAEEKRSMTGVFIMLGLVVAIIVGYKFLK